MRFSLRHRRGPLSRHLVVLHPTVTVGRPLGNLVGPLLQIGDTLAVESLGQQPAVHFEVVDVIAAEAALRETSRHDARIGDHRGRPPHCEPVAAPVPAPKSGRLLGHRPGTGMAALRACGPPRLGLLKTFPISTVGSQSSPGPTAGWASNLQKHRPFRCDGRNGL